MLSVDLLKAHRHLSTQPLTVVDVETTGSLASSSRITEISVLQASLADGILDQTTSLINPQTPIPPRIVEVTGITQSMVAIAPPAAEVLPNFLSNLQQGVLTAHNLEFDYGFLRAEYARLGTGFQRSPDEQFCTVKLARLMLPDLPSRSLPVLVRHFGFDVGRSHRAEADAQACWLLAQRLLTDLLTEPDDILLARFAKQWLPLKDAAKLLGCSAKVGQTRLETSGAPSRFMGRGKTGTFAYRRGDVERLLEAQQDDIQLSWF
jgi:DNA polymerase III subunit epsilon